MRAHAEFGAHLVADLPGLAPVAPAVRHHHERWDGAGYPEALAGEAIPLEARIVAAADALSAMTGDRVHRRARVFGDALEELRRERGRQFDPRVVDAVLAVVAARAERMAGLRGGRGALAA